MYCFHEYPPLCSKVPTTMTLEEKYRLEILHQDNHTLIINKCSSDIVQGDKTGDVPVSERIKSYLKEKYNKTGNVFCGVVHRLDRPTSGVLLFARTSKALSRLNDQFRSKTTQKTYWALVERKPEKHADTLEHWLLKNEKQNKSYVVAPDRRDAKRAALTYRYLISSEYYHLLEIELLTGRHHQIRCQLAHIGCPIKGDVKYGATRSNSDGSIHLHARKLCFVHPTTKQTISIEAPVPHDKLWGIIERQLTNYPSFHSAQTQL